MTAAAAAGRALDDLLFQPDDWFAIDTSNRRVAGLLVASLEDGLSLVEAGEAASVVGRLTPAARVVDVDLTGERGHQATARLVDWCRSHNVWHLVRPSGGADGRHHVFVVPGRHLEALQHAVAALRVDLRAAATGLDLRRQVRPLTAPHRTGRRTRPLGDPAAHLRALRALLAPQAATPAARGEGDNRGSGADGHDAAQSADGRTVRPPAGPEPRRPRPRPLRALPGPWESYLRDGVKPPIGGTDRSRSTYELIATVQLLRAGHTAETAWARILTAHPEAMTRARANRRRWVAYVWNDVVDTDAALPHALPTRPADGHTLDSASDSTDEHVDGAAQVFSAAVQHARGRLQALAWSLPPRQRPTLLLVGHAVLDRAQRTSQRRVPVPERNLALDTGLRDRKAIRSALAALDGALGVLHRDCWTPGHDRDTTSYEFELHPPPEPDDRAMSQLSPPGTHTPHPLRAPGSTWAVLPRQAHQIWRALTHQLPSHGDPPQTPPEAAGLTLEQLMHEAALLDSPGDTATPGQRRRLHATLRELLRAGLVARAAGGRWTATHSPTTASDTTSTTASPSATATARLVERRQAEHQQLVDAERHAYRSAATSTWARDRLRALRHVEARYQNWWATLPPTERAERRASWARRFHDLPLNEQHRIKTDLAERRVAAGGTERQRHDHWIRTQPHTTYAQRCADRARWYATLAPPLQAAHAAAWAHHRDRFDIPRGHHTPGQEHDQLLPHGPDQRDTSHLERETTQQSLVPHPSAARPA